MSEPQRVRDLARRPRVRLVELMRAAGADLAGVPPEAWLSVDIEFKYDGYLAREREAAQRLAELADFQLPGDLPYLELHSLSTEARQKLEAVRPRSLAQAGRIPGVSPADLQNLVLEAVRRRRAVA